MPHPLITLGVIAALVLGSAAALDTVAARAAAQARNPLTGARSPVRPAPPWANTSWLNTDGEQPLTLANLRGRVILLNFWTFTCWNCTGALPSLVQYDRLYRAQGLVIVGIHSPEFPPYGGEHDKANVRAAVRKHQIRYPVAQDNDHATWRLYDIQYWPSYVLIDRRGQIRWEGYGEFHVGDDSHREWDRRIRALLAEAG
ncbi:MAG: redoxin domain-containing protein [Gemmatimonadales bacterium]|nr:redoxin domain-containing protein [Gemmatimonadales bacterium]